MRSGHIPRYASTVSIQVRSQLEQKGGCSDCQVHQVGYLASVVSHAANSSILLQDSPTLFTGFDCKFYSYIDEMRDGSQFTAFDQLTPQVSMTFSHLNWANKNDFGAISGLDTSRFGALITGYVYCHTSGPQRQRRVLVLVAPAHPARSASSETWPCQSPSHAISLIQNGALTSW